MLSPDCHCRHNHCRVTLCSFQLLCSFISAVISSCKCNTVHSGPTFLTFLLWLYHALCWFPKMSLIKQIPNDDIPPTIRLPTSFGKLKLSFWKNKIQVKMIIYTLLLTTLSLCPLFLNDRHETFKKNNSCQYKALTFNLFFFLLLVKNDDVIKPHPPLQSDHAHP